MGCVVERRRSFDGEPTPNSSDTVLDDNSRLEIAMSPDNPDPDNNLGEGIDSRSFSWYEDVFLICTRGKDDSCVWTDAGTTNDFEHGDEDIVDLG